MILCVSILVFVTNLALGAPLPAPQDAAPTTTVPSEAELLSLLPILSFLSTFALSKPTSTVSVFVPTSTVEPSALQTTAEAITSTTTSTSSEQQQTQPPSTTVVENQDFVNSGNNVQATQDVTHGPVTFGELTTPSEGGNFNKFVENGDDGSNSTTKENSAPSSVTRSALAPNTLTSHTFFTATTAASPTENLSSKVVSKHSPTPSSKASTSIHRHHSAAHAHETSIVKRLFPSLFKDDEGFDRFDAGFSQGNNVGSGKNGNFLPPNVVSPQSSLFGFGNSNSQGSNDKNGNSGNKSNGSGGSNSPPDGSDTPPSGLFIPPSQFQGSSNENGNSDNNDNEPGGPNVPPPPNELGAPPPGLDVPPSPGPVIPPPGPFPPPPFAPPGPPPSPGSDS